MVGVACEACGSLGGGVYCEARDGEVLMNWRLAFLGGVLGGKGMTGWVGCLGGSVG